ncbi:hypothetical protein PS15p_212027 [Mucor circinelloides]
MLFSSQKDIVILHNLELNYEPKLYINRKDSFQMTLNLSKEGVYYSCYVQDWRVLSFLINMKKGDYVSIMGSFKVVQKQNANGFTKFTIKLTATEMQLEQIAVKVERELNNTGDMRLLLLKHAYVNLDNQEKISSALTSDEIAKEMKAMVLEAFDKTTRGISIIMVELLKSEKDKVINEDLNF